MAQKKSFYLALLLLLAALPCYGARQSLDVEADFTSFNVLDNATVFQEPIPEGIYVELRQPDTLWFTRLSLPKNATFRNLFVLETRVGETFDWPLAGLCLGNDSVKFLFTYFHPRGIFELSMLSGGNTTVIARESMDPLRPPCTLKMVYNAQDKTLEGWHDGFRKISISGNPLTPLASITQAAIVTGTTGGHHSCKVTYDYLKLHAE
ncbi:MAG TPA: hypothetical protein PLW97_03195 [Synergistaceae bacterium]|nr:hypothetical protein [Synergistaceae bacterium]HPQ36627.1 hypothetical protein [Synergistaceae bacterium]